MKYTLKRQHRFNLPAVPAHATPIAIHAPYLTWALKDSARRDTSFGTASVERT